MSRSRVVASSTALVLVALLTACASSEPPVAEEPTAEPTLAPTVEPTPEPTPLAFAMPDDCTTILPQERLDDFASQNLALLGGPGGVYGDDYFFDPTPEQLAGGISCVFAEDGVDLSSLLISVAPISPATRPGIINDLIAQGLNEGLTPEGAVTYSQQGDEGVVPAIYNLISDESWISVISTFGGPIFYEEAVTLAEEVALQVYR